MDDRVKAVFDDYEPDTRERLLALRALIYETAAQTDGVGPLNETLKWGQISYLNPAGTTLRIDTAPGSTDAIALYVHCQTSIVETLRARYDGLLAFEGTRCVILPDDGEVPPEVVRDCIRAAPTYRLRP
jgi:hypothetical protein